MKRTDLEKSVGIKINNKMKNSGGASLFGKDAVKPVDKREQRKIDQAMGLVSFAVKINSELVQHIYDIAKEKQIGVNEVVTELLQKGLEKGK